MTKPSRNLNNEADPMECPVCRREEGWQEIQLNGDESDRGNRRKIDCTGCGTFVVTRMAEIALQGDSSADHKLSAWIRRQNLFHGNEPLLTRDNLPTIRASLPSYPVASRAVELLRAIAAHSQHPGFVYEGLLGSDAPLAWAENSDELRFHLRSLEDTRLLELSDVSSGYFYKASVTAEGWRQIEQGSSITEPRAFVAMSFAPEMAPCWTDGLRPGIEDAGYIAHRVDSELHVQPIDQKIVADIRTSLFTVVDVTQQKQGAYFEAGLALGFGKTVVWTVRKDELAQVHFDTRQFAHIVWTDYADLRQKLRDMIVAVVGPGPRYSAEKD